MPRLSATAVVLAALAAPLALPLAACGPADSPVERASGAGPPRPFLMGVSSVPTAPSDVAYEQAFAFAGRAGEVVLVQRAPPWTDFLPGARISERTQGLTRMERRLAREFRLKLFLAIDPTDPVDRGRLAGLPPDLAGRDFSDARVRAALISYAKYLALNYKPAYLAFGVEVDMFFRRVGDGLFRNFVSLYFEAYDAVKSVSPGTLVFPTFQFEGLEGKLPVGDAAPQPLWSLVARFEPKIDMLAVSSFPGFVLGDGHLPADYYAPLGGRLPKPLALAAIGWQTSPTADAPFEGEGSQAEFLRAALAQAEAIGASLVVWYLGRDLATLPGSAFDRLASAGLYRADGQPKAAWHTWRLWADRPPH